MNLNFFKTEIHEQQIHLKHSTTRPFPRATQPFPTHLPQGKAIPKTTQQFSTHLLEGMAFPKTTQINSQGNAIHFPSSYLYENHVYDKRV
jgi:hypothetical protein